MLLFRYFFAAIVSFFLISSGVQASTVVTSIPPLSLLVRDLSPEPDKTLSLLAASQSPHGVTLSVSQVRQLQQADLFIWVGPDFESSFSKAITRFVAPEKVLQLSGLPFFGPVQPEFHEAKERRNEAHSDTDHEHHEHGADAHLWLGYDSGIVIAKAVAGRLVQIYPADARYIESRLETLIARLHADKLSAHTQLSKHNDRGFAVFHDGYSRFVDEFGLQQLSHITLVPDQQVSLNQMLVLKVELQHAACLISDLGELPQARRLAARLGLTVTTVDLLASGPMDKTAEFKFANYLGGIVKSFSRCLSTTAI